MLGYAHPHYVKQLTRYLPLTTKGLFSPMGYYNGFQNLGDEVSVVIVPLRFGMSRGIVPTASRAVRWTSAPAREGMGRHAADMEPGERGDAVEAAPETAPSGAAPAESDVVGLADGLGHQRQDQAEPARRPAIGRQGTNRKHPQHRP